MACSLLFDVKVADEIRAIRKRLNLTQKEVGARLGLSTRTVMRWEKGTHFPRPGDLELMRTWTAKTKWLTERPAKKKRGA